MLLSALLVMLISANSDAAVGPATDACTNPILSYTYDSAQPGDRSIVTCLVCDNTTTWRMVDAAGDKRVVTRPIVDISHLHTEVDQVRQGNITETLNPGADSPTVFYWAHPTDAPKFLLKAQQKDHHWTNDAVVTSALVDAIDSICAGQL